MPSPAISVVIPLYNKEKEILRSLRSVLAQTFQNFEIIIVNDGSTDKSLSLVRTINDERIRVFDQTNGGVSSARNRGICEAKAGLVAFLDADDEWLPEFLELVLNLTERYPSCSVFATSYLLATRGGNCAPAILKGCPQGFEDGVLSDYFGVASQSDPPLCSSGVAVSKKALLSVGSFQQGITAGEDLLTWARLASKCQIAYSVKPCAIFWMPMRNLDRSGRTPQLPDIVGDELSKLLQDVSGPAAASLRRYISLWHKMRANIFLQIGNGHAARLEVKKAVEYAGISSQLIVFGFLSLLPAKLGSPLFWLLQNLKKKIRKKHLVTEA